MDRIHELTKIDKWFLQKLQNIINTASELREFNDLEAIPEALLRQAKEQGFSDFQIAREIYQENLTEPEKALLQVRDRRSLGISRLSSRSTLSPPNIRHRPTTSI